MKHILYLGAFLIGFNAVTYSQQTSWQWVNPLPQGNILNALWAVNKDTVVAVAELGTVIRTGNGGKSWQVEPNIGGITDQLFAVQFASGTTGWVVGEAGRLMKTIDGGATWFPQDIPTIKDLFAINFISATTGWVGGADGVVFKTTNGGTTWIAESSATASTLYGFYFQSATAGWAVGTTGAIVATTNGGTTWQAQTSGTTQSLYGVHFTSSTIGFAVGSFGVMLKTSNGGSTWLPVVSGTDLSLYGVQFTSSSTGWAVGAYGTIIKTTNSGTSWFLQSSGTYNDLFGVRFASATIGWTMGDFGTIAATTDGGATWVEQSTGVKVTLNAVHFPNSTTGYAVGEEGTIVRSTDAGLSWNPVPSSVFQTLYGVFLFTNSVGWAVGDSAVIVKTTNGGSTWFEQNSHTDPTLYSVHFVNANLGWAVGDFGTILHTTNTGSSWLPQTSHTTTSLLKVQFLDANTGFAVGYGGIIVKTTNGGTTWTNLTSGTTRTLYSLDIIDANKVYIVGDFGAILYTSNGGTTWVTQSTNTDASLYGVSFSSASTGWAAGDDGTVIKTTDGGTTWALQNSATLHTLWDVQYVQSSSTAGGVLFAAGVGGTIVCSSVSPLPLRTWTGATDTLWTTPGNWSPSGPPEKLDSVYIPVTANKPALRITRQQINLSGLRIAAGTKLTVGPGLAQFVIKGSLYIDGTLEIEPSSTTDILIGGDFLVGSAGKFSPGGSTVTMTTTGALKGTFNNLFISDGTNIRSSGNIEVKNNLTLIANLALRQTDTLTLLNSDPQAFQGFGIVTAGTIKRSIRPATTSPYRFESAVSFLQFRPTGTLPDTILMTTTPNTLAPGLSDTVFVKRYYSITAKGGSNFLSNLSLRYDSAESSISIENLALFRDSSNVIFNMGKTDYLDSDLVAISLDSVRRFSKWYLGRMDYTPRHAMQFTDSLFIHDNTSVTDTLQFGAIPLATDGIDPAFGETQLGPKPPLGTFDARWSIPSTQGTLLDLKDIITTAHQENIYTCTFQPGPGGYPFTLRWNTSVFPIGTFVLRDAATQGTQFSVDMKSQNSYVISNPAITSVQIVHKSAKFFTMNQNWNMISIPLTVFDGRKSKVFPTAISNAFGYSNLYYVADTMKNGRGYWIKFANGQDVGIEGFPRSTDTMNVVDGWNLIGSISSPVAIGDVIQQSAGIVRSNYFGYNNGYAPSDSIRPAKAYWVKIAGTGKLILSGTGGIKPSSTALSLHDDLQQFNSLTVADHEGNNEVLYFGSVSTPSFTSDFYELPPAPPEGCFDARFSSNRLIDVMSSGTHSSTLNIQSRAYPITITWHLIQPSLHSLKLTDTRTGIPLHSGSAARDGSLRILDPSITAVTLRTEAVSSIPKEFSLKQNYPNPFNPTTQIEFELPTQSQVTLKIFNLLGQEVVTLADHQLYVAGEHTVTFNAANVSSGVYLYKLSAQGSDRKDFQQVKKMLLIK